MKCPYSRQEAQAVTNLFESAISELEAALQAAAQREAVLEDELNCLRESDELERMLDKLPVKMLKDKASSVRVKLFQDAGYKTVGSVYRSTAEQLQLINGVGEMTSAVALNAAKQIRNDLAAQYPVELELSRRTDEAERLVCDALVCVDAAEARRQSKNLLERYGKRLRDDIAAVKNTQGFLMWVLSNDKDQVAATRAVEELFSFEEQGFAEKARELTSSLYEAGALGIDQAWERFERDSGELEEFLRPLHASVRRQRDDQRGMQM
ncbi:MAG: hypothetical protein J5449_13225 [Oscillospiraceae bacterium]|nr:hypothetical protein [Oscillospiraceae bacterium]